MNSVYSIPNLVVIEEKIHSRLKKFEWHTVSAGTHQNENNVRGKKVNCIYFDTFFLPLMN